VLHLVDVSNRHLPKYEQLLEASYRVRHEQYVKGRGWKALDRPDGREIDQFDNADATYLLWADGTEVLGGARFVPTNKPHLMSVVFPQIVTLGPIPNSPKIWELTRMFSSRDGGSPVDRRRVTADVFIAMFEMALHCRLNTISIVCDTFFVTRFLNMGIDVKPLGLPTPYDEGTCIAVTLPVNTQQLVTVRNFTGREQHREAVLFDVLLPDPVRQPPYPRPEIHASH
jgi:acyl-homoserine lactone synthase